MVLAALVLAAAAAARWDPRIALEKAGVYREARKVFSGSARRLRGCSSSLTHRDFQPYAV